MFTKYFAASLFARIACAFVNPLLISVCSANTFLWFYRLSRICFTVSSCMFFIFCNPFLQSLSDAESIDYIVHKLKCAGSSKAIIEETALEAVDGHSHGNPRLIDKLMSDALLIGSQQEKKCIDTAVILAAVNNQNLG